MNKVDWNKAPDEATHALTTAPEWDGAPSMIGEVEFCQQTITGSFPPYWMDDKTGWVVLETRPEENRHPKQERYIDGGQDWIDVCSEQLTTEEFRGAMKFTIGKYMRRLGKKDDPAQEVTKIADYAERWRQYETEDNTKV